MHVHIIPVLICESPFPQSWILPLPLFLDVSYSAYILHTYKTNPMDNGCHYKVLGKSPTYLLFYNTTHIITSTVTYLHRLTSAIAHQGPGQVCVCVLGVGVRGWARGGGGVTVRVVLWGGPQHCMSKCEFWGCHSQPFVIANTFGLICY